ncbi:Uma2 family endonuclease [Oculatella sp. FACHB-28]|uniref:Uma2 family endonuclease n=1 Tax=Cyanophyceae TaxID=3028117 RepID=UPI001683F983|nr:MULTISPECIES: Uma2 family endonuclease [Cyanophyceae]MBD1997070.1 Uma2 family endonuclease [Leptolyngbya sp. FACHB-541]MBD2055900.1 Uma2 family endonuclease [Oculatella sp. FACHB-28]
MLQALQQPITFDEFFEWLPETSECRYELRRGAIVEMPKPTGKHSNVSGNLAYELGAAIRQANLPYFIPRECIVRSVDGNSGYEPDVIVLDESALIDEPQWESGSIITLGKSVKIIVEVVSTNWRDDYFMKLGEYEALGIQEYWIVDHVALGGRRFIGNPKQPTITVCQWVDGEYELQQFRAGDRLNSPTFPSLKLTVDQIFATG